MSVDNTQIEYCNWSFNECLNTSLKWLVKRDCEDKPINLNRGDSKNWKVYKASLDPTLQYSKPFESSKCPKCHKYINGVNPYDDGETWRR